MYEWQEPRGLIPSRIHNPVVFEPGSIRDAFEDGKEFFFERVVPEEKQRAMKASLIENDEKLARLGHPKIRSRFQNY